MPIVTKLTDIRLVNNEIKGMLVAARTEYFVMAGTAVRNANTLTIDGTIYDDFYVGS